MNGTHQLLFYADDGNLLSENISIIHKNTETLLGFSREVGIGVNVLKTKHVFMPSGQITGWSLNNWDQN